MRLSESDKAELASLYHTLRVPMEDLAKMYRVSVYTVWRWVNAVKAEKPKTPPSGVQYKDDRWCVLPKGKRPGKQFRDYEDAVAYSAGEDTRA